MDYGDLLIADTGVWHGDTAMNNVTISLDGIDVVFSVVDGKFDVEYDKDMITESAEAFFVALKDYFSAHITLD